MTICRAGAGGHRRVYAVNTAIRACKGGHRQEGVVIATASRCQAANLLAHFHRYGKTTPVSVTS
jgi:hypothetical protein